MPGGFGWLVWVCLFSSGLLDFGVFCVDWFGLRDLVGGVHWSLVAGFGVVSWCFVNLLAFGVFGGVGIIYYLCPRFGFPDCLVATGVWCLVRVLVV